MANNKSTLWLKITEDRQEGAIDKISEILSKYKGNTEIIIYEVKDKKKFKAPKNLYVKISDSLISELTSLLGEECVVIKP